MKRNLQLQQLNMSPYLNKGTPVAWRQTSLFQKLVISELEGWCLHLILWYPGGHYCPWFADINLLPPSFRNCNETAASWKSLIWYYFFCFKLMLFYCLYTNWWTCYINLVNWELNYLQCFKMFQMYQNIGTGFLSTGTRMFLLESTGGLKGDWDAASKVCMYSGHCHTWRSDKCSILKGKNRDDPFNNRISDD